MSYGADDGQQTPSAPESPRGDAPREAPREAMEHGDEGRAESRRLRLLPVWILLAATVVSGGAWAVSEYMGAAPPPDEASVPLITAYAEPWKVRPDDPGGMEIPNRDALIYETLTTSDPEEAPERVRPPPEEPMSPPRPQPEADGSEEPPPPAPDAAPDAAPGAAPDTASEAAAAPPVEEREPAPVEEAPLPPLPAEDAASPEPATPPARAQAEDADPVPLPVFKPGRRAQAEPPRAAVPAAVPEPAPEPAPELAQPTTRNGRYVQLLSANARSSLEAHWEMLRTRHGDVLIGLSPLIMPVDSGDNGIMYRLRAGPLGDAGAARRVCERLKARGLDCFVPPN